VNNCLRYRVIAQHYNLAEVCERCDQVIAENFVDVVQHEDLYELDLNIIISVLDARKEWVSFNGKFCQNSNIFSGRLVQWFLPGSSILF